jgi:hypothetical protein
MSPGMQVVSHGE